MARPAMPWRLYAHVLALPLVVMALITAIAISAVNVLGGVRAYVSGESVWSKSRSEAVQHLLRYADSRDARDLQRFHAALTSPRHNRTAREAMSRAELNQELVRSAMIGGGSAPEDVDNMIFLFRRFGHLWLFKDAVADWTHGDTLIEQLNAHAEQLRQAVAAHASPTQMREILDRMMAVNDELQRTERHFSTALGQAARQTETLLIASMIAIALILAFVSSVQVRRVLIKQAEHQARLDTVSRRWELASTAAGMGLYELDHATETITFDAKSAAMHGLNAEPIVLPRTTVRALIMAEDADKTRADTDAALDAGSIYKIVYRVRWPDHSVHTLEATGRMVQTHPHQPGRLIGVLRDITDERAQANAAIERDAATRVAQAQREFLSRLSHELRTPLNAILGFAQLMLLDRQRLSNNHINQLDMIHSAGQQLLRLVEDVLDLSKVETGDILIEPQDVDACALLRSCAAMIETHSARAQVSLIDRLPARPLVMRADARRLQQVFINLLTNACKYNRPGGTVVLDARSSADRILINITDTGFGLSASEAEQIFQPFKRFNNDPTIEGTGLGLYIVKQLIDRMQGQISVTSDPGSGTCFTLSLPARDQQ